MLEVTTYPEINDLFAVADVAITDYSSIMFDYSVTGKPMLFFVPDLDDYRDRRRGVYFDLGESAPGPLLATTEEVAEALRSLDPAAYARVRGEVRRLAGALQPARRRPGRGPRGGRDLPVRLMALVCPRRPRGRIGYGRHRTHRPGSRVLPRHPR